MDTERVAINHEFYPTLSRQPDRDGWSPGHVTVQLHRPKEKLAVEAWVRGPFAVHETVSGATLTHAPTGLAIYRFDAMEQAAECAERIEAIDDFASRKKAYPSGSEVYPKVRAVIDEIVAQPLSSTMGEKS